MKPKTVLLFVNTCCLLVYVQAATGRESPPRLTRRSEGEGGSLPPGVVVRLGTNCLRIPGVATAIALSPIGDLVAVGCRGKVFRWNAATGDALATIEFDGDVKAIGFLSDGERMAVVSWNARKIPVAQIIDGAGRRKHSVPCGCEPVCWGAPLAVSPDGKIVAFVDREEDFSLWEFGNSDAAVALPPLSMKKRGAAVALAFSPDGRRLAASLGDGNAAEATPIAVYDVPTRKKIAELKGHTRGVVALSYSADGATLLSSGLDRTVRVWDLAKNVQTGVVEGCCVPAAFTPDGRLAVVGTVENSFAVVDLHSRKRIHEFPCDGISQMRLAFSADGKRFAAAGNTSGVGLWNSATWTDAVRQPGHRGRIEDLIFTPDGRTLVSIGVDQSVRLWDVGRGSERRVLWLPPAGDGGVLGTRPLLDVSPDGAILAAISGSSADVKVRFWGVERGDLLAAWEPVKTGSWSLGFVADGKVLATASLYGVQFWSVPDPKQISFSAHRPAAGDAARRGALHHMAVSGGRGFIATAQDAMDVVDVFDYSTQRQLLKIDTKNFGTEQIRFSANGRVLAASAGGVEGRQMTRDRRISLWETATGGFLGAVGDGKAICLYHFAFSHDGRLMAISDSERDRVRVWSVVSGKELASFEGGQGPVSVVAFAPDGKLLAAGGYDGTILLWDVSKLDRSVGPKPGAKEVAAAWEVLGGAGGDGVLRAVYTLAAAGDEAVALIRGKVKSAPGVDAKEVVKLLGRLDDESFAVRSEAAGRLAALGDAVRPALEKSLEVGGGSAEYRKQVRRLLDDAPVKTPTGEALRSLRAVWVLEEVGTASAREWLKELAAGRAGERLTTAAREALERLERRTRR